MSLDVAYDPDNIFAKILRGDLPAHKVHETEHALAFLDLFPQGPGHTLVIPKIAAANLLTFPTEAFGPYMAAVQTVARGVRAAFDADGVTVFQFNGAAGGQSVFHLHFHVIPRHEGRSLGAHGAGGRADDATLAPMAARIRDAIAAL